LTNAEQPHIALAKHRTRHKSQWLEIGEARMQKDENTGQITAHVQLNRMPIGGFDGYVLLLPPGATPPEETAAPRRPNEPEETSRSV
jgi:hypothetical protein